MAQLFCDENENLVPIGQDFMTVYENWQKLNSAQKSAIVSHIKSYID